MVLIIIQKLEIYNYTKKSILEYETITHTKAICYVIGQF